MNKLNPYENYPSTVQFKYLSDSYRNKLQEISKSIWTAFSKDTPTKLSAAEIEFVFKCLTIEVLLQAEHDQVGAGSVINVTNQFIELRRGISNASNILTLSDEMRKHSFTEAYQSNNIYFTAVNFPGSSSAGPNVYQYVEEMWKEETPTLIGRIKSAVANKLTWIRWHKISPNMQVAIISGVFTLIGVLLGKFM